MPELAEVDTVCTQLDDRLAGRRSSSVDVYYPKWLKHGDPDDFVGQRLVRVRRWGKRLWWEWEMGIWVGSLGMTGTVRIDAPSLPHPMLELRFDETVVTWYDPRHFGSLYVCRSAEQALGLLGDRVGVDAAAEIGPARLAKILDTSMGIKAALLEQRRVAGIGNYLADEILWQSRIHPGIPARSLSFDAWERLDNARVNVVGRALAAGGLSVRDYHDVDGTAGKMEAALHAYGRAGESCDRCGNILVKGVYGGRGTVWCPSCQRPLSTAGQRRRGPRR